MHRSAVVVVAVALAIVSGGKAVAADPALVEAARKEGKVVWYTTLIVNQAVAGRVQADVFDGITNMIPLKRARLLASYSPAAAVHYPLELKDAEGYWNALLLYVFAPGINTTLVPKERAPRTYQELLDPQWKGKMAWNP